MQASGMTSGNSLQAALANANLGQNQDLELACGAHSRRDELTRQQSHLTKRPAWSDAIDLVLDPVSVRNEHVRESALNNVQIAQAVTLDKEGRTG